MPLNKKEEEWKPDPDMVEMIDSAIELAEQNLIHVQAWVDKANQRLDWARYRKKRYLKDGTYLPMYPKEKGEKEKKTK